MNAAEKLAHEIERVTKLRAQYESLRGMPQVSVEFAVSEMTASLDRAKAAAGTDDGVDVLRALAELAEWTG